MTISPCTGVTTVVFTAQDQATYNAMITWATTYSKEYTLTKANPGNQTVTIQKKGTYSWPLA